MTVGLCWFGSTLIRSVILQLVLCSLFLSFGACAHDCSGIPAEQVETLRQIAREVGKRKWNCSADLCTNSQNDNCWKSKMDNTTGSANLVNCTCKNGICHVSDIYWKFQNLTGVLPKSLAKLPRIKTIDLAGNVLTGTIPPEWADTKLVFLSVFANRLSGPIPKYLGNISTLTNLSLESNHFNGIVPAELGHLINLTTLFLSDNQLTGHLPMEFSNLINLQFLSLSSNNFNGSLPDYFDHYSELQYLELIGSGFEGPIPSSISSLHKLKTLRISDLQGAEGSAFPSLEKLTQLGVLVLRSCNITGDIPQYVGNPLKLNRILDLSFNNLTGTVPNMPFVENLYLTGNMLSGPIPDWIKSSDDYRHIDLSYNDFNDTFVEDALCHSSTLNLYRCNAKQKTLDSSACLNNLRCSKAQYSLHINCGGKEISIGKIKYEQDIETNAAATFFQSNANWGFSSSGEFWVDYKKPSYYIAQNTSILQMDNAELYKEARLSASSLTYYGRCLAKGNYNVTLYFAEIVLSDDDSYLSTGRRVFDIFIQGKLYVKDFDIVKEAKGTNKALRKTFTDIPVNNSIEIRFYYVGKGSTNIPVKGNYGPLISAISVESQFNPPFDWKIVMWVLIGSALCLSGIVAGLLWRKHRMAYIRSREQELRVLNPQIGLFTYQQIKAACNNFSVANKIGQGGFGSVYMGTLLNGVHIAVKQLSAKSSQGIREFVTEIGMISTLYHPNLVKLYGCCVDTSQLILVYEYLENKDLGSALFASDESRSRLDWPTRKSICIGIARGLAFLHEESSVKIVHRDIKATNILLDSDLSPKISDFGLARLNEEEYTHISTRVAGTIGYMAPEYALRGYLTPKADVYSFGVVILELMAGRSNMQLQPEENHFCLLDWALVLKQKGDLMDLMDPTLGTDYIKEEASMIIQVALLCTNPSPALRPTMSEALNMLEGNTELPELILEPNSSYGLIYKAPSFENETQTTLMHSSDVQSFDSSPKAYSRSFSG